MCAAAAEQSALEVAPGVLAHGAPLVDGLVPQEAVSAHAGSGRELLKLIARHEGVREVQTRIGDFNRFVCATAQHTPPFIRISPEFEI